MSRSGRLDTLMTIYVQDLLIVIGGVILLALFLNAPEGTTFLVAVLVGGYLGSAIGFWGTIAGLLGGAIAGMWLALFVGILFALPEALVAVTRQGRARRKPKRPKLKAKAKKGGGP